MALEFGIGWPLLHNDPHVYCSGGQCLDTTGGVSRLKGIFQFWINIWHVIFDDLGAQKNPRLQGVFFLSLHVQYIWWPSAVLIPRLQTFFLVQVPKTLHSEAHSDYIFDIPAISLGEILGSLGLGNNIDLSLGFIYGKNIQVFSQAK